MTTIERQLLFNSIYHKKNWRNQVILMMIFFFYKIKCHYTKSLYCRDFKHFPLIFIIIKFITINEVRWKEKKKRKSFLSLTFGISILRNCFYDLVLCDCGKLLRKSLTIEFHTKSLFVADSPHFREFIVKYSILLLSSPLKT